MVAESRVDVRTVEGTLLMGDFMEGAYRCRIHPQAGEPVVCRFGREQKIEVLAALTHYVRITGNAVEAGNGEVEVLITTIKVLDNPAVKNDGIARFDAQGRLRRLAAEQGVSPITDFDVLPGEIWPEDESIDEFIAETMERRRVGSRGDRL